MLYFFADRTSSKRNPRNTLLDGFVSLFLTKFTIIFDFILSRYSNETIVLKAVYAPLSQTLAVISCALNLIVRYFPQHIVVNTGHIDYWLTAVPAL